VKRTLCHRECADMTRNTLVTALGFGVLTFSFLQVCVSESVLAEGNCPPGQTDKLERYAGTCVDPKLIDPETGRLRKASKCPPGESDTTKHYKGTCVRLDQLDETGRLRKQIGKEEETAPQRPMKIIKKKPQAEENPCGKGWYKAADGQCYPRLN
jgi:hypothetical protein